MSTLLARIEPGALSSDDNAPTTRETKDGLFTIANSVSTTEVLDWLSIVYTDSNRGEMATCPGCGEDGALICKDGGIKCLHDRCATVGPPKKKGYRTNVDIVAHVQNLKAADAAKAICVHFGKEVPQQKKGNDCPRFSNDDPGDPPAHLFEGEENLNFAPKRSRIEIIEADAIFAELTPPDYLFGPIIVSGSVTEIIAYGSSGKSWMGEDAVISAAAGVPWLGRFAAQQGPALYLDYENGTYESRRRMQAICRARDLVTPVVGLSLASMPALYLNSPDLQGDMEPLADGRSLIVIDTLRAATPGVDENDSRMRAGIDTLHRIGERTGCSFLLLAHAKKTSGSITTIDPREAGRGSSAIFDAADTVLHVTYEEGKPLTVTQTKARAGKAVEPFQVVIRDTDDGGVLVVAQDAPEAQADNSEEFEELCSKVLEVVRANPGSSGRVVRAHAGGRPGNVGAALEVLERHGAVRNTGTDKAAKWFPTSTKESS